MSNAEVLRRVDTCGQRQVVLRANSKQLSESSLEALEKNPKGALSLSLSFFPSKKVLSALEKLK